MFDELFQLLRSETPLDIAVGEYEMVKASAGVTLSTRLFERNQERTNCEWAQIRTTLGI